MIGGWDDTILSTKKHKIIRFWKITRKPSLELMISNEKHDNNKCKDKDVYFHQLKKVSMIILIIHESTLS